MLYFSLSYGEEIDFYSFSVCCGTPQAIGSFLRNNGDTCDVNICNSNFCAPSHGGAPSFSKKKPAVSGGRPKFEKSQKGKPLCVLGRDVTMDLVPALSLRSLVGKMEFVKISRVDLLEWIRDVWKPFIKNIPRVLALVNGFVFHFLLEEDR